MVFQLILALSLRFFFFDFVLFKRIRKYLKTKGYVFRKLLACPFCQGFWCGLGVFGAFQPVSFSWTYLVSLLSFGFISAYLGLIAAVVFYPLIEKFEQRSGMPLL